MNAVNLAKEIGALPEGAQREVVDFVAFLKQRQLPPLITSRKPSILRKSPFLGMWKNRPDMPDGAIWTRNLRQSEWRG